MQVPGSNSVSSHIPIIWEGLSSILHDTTNRVVNYFKEIQSSLYKTDLWEQTAKPWYERTIQPLTIGDYTLLTSSLIVAVIITVIALNTLGIAILPLIVGSDAVMVLGACTISRNHVHKHFNNIAWNHVNNMRLIARGVTFTNQNFTKIAENRGLLNKPEFERLSEDKKELDKNIHQFENLIKDPKNRDFIDGKSTFLKKLEALQEKLVPGRKVKERKFDKKIGPKPEKPLPVTAHDDSKVLDAKKIDQIQPRSTTGLEFQLQENLVPIQDRELDKKTDSKLEKPLSVTTHEESKVLDAKKTDQIQRSPTTGLEFHIEEDKKKTPLQSSSDRDVEIVITEEKAQENLINVEIFVEEVKKTDDSLDRSSPEILVQEESS